MDIQTGNKEIGFIEWNLEIQWKLKKAIRDQKIISLDFRGQEMRLETNEILAILIEFNSILSWDREEQVTEEEIFDLPILHTEQLAIIVAGYLMTGKVENMEEIENEVEEQEAPLVSK